MGITGCSGYGQEEVARGVRRIWEAAWGNKDVRLRGKRVLVKVNHLGAPRREAAIATDPSVTAAVVTLLKEEGARVTVGDGLVESGHGGFVPSGYEAFSKQYGFDLVNFKDGEYVERANPAGGKFRSFHISRHVVEADAVVNVAKLKTHMLTMFTGAVKNTYGYLPVGLRRSLHSVFPAPGEFAKAVVGIYMTREPAFSIVDGIEALSGQGPSSGGTRRTLGVLLGSTDAVAVDATACRIIGLAPEKVPTLVHGQELGVGVKDESMIEIVGGRVEDYRVEDFALPSGLVVLPLVDRLPGVLARGLEQISSLTRRYPRIMQRRCVGCGMCSRQCPRHAIAMKEGKAAIDYAACISCFCCQEFCAWGAIRVRGNALWELAQQTLQAVRGPRKAIMRGVRCVLGRGGQGP